MTSGKIKRKILLSFLVGLLFTSLIWLGHVLVSERVPLLLLNMMGILAIPGNVVTTVIVGIASPEKGWQAIHGAEPYNYISYGMNFLFYFFMVYLLQSLLSKFRQGRK